MFEVRTIRREGWFIMIQNPQRLYAGLHHRLEKIQSGLHGDMQRVAEMTTPLHSGIG